MLKQERETVKVAATMLRQKKKKKKLSDLPAVFALFSPDKNRTMGRVPGEKQSG